ncbi:MAG TPA: nuclease-related domain-containing protein [Thermomicrobiales bacterium]|nr:nuclease-related domain-containing protein [Thermomicrobiales bacterium]
MRIVRHNQFVKQRKRRARLFAFLGFLILTSSLLIAWYPSFLMLAYVAMLAGFILFNMGMQQVGKWTRNPRNDQIIDHHLKNLSDRFTIIHYAQFGKQRAEHVVVHPGGLLVVTAREIDGDISKKGNRWQRKGSMFRRFFSFSGPQLGNPSYETEAIIGNVEKFLEQEQLEVDVEGAIVFVHPKAELDIEDPDYPVLHGDELAGFLQGLPADVTFTNQERDRLVQLLAAGENVEQPKQAVGRRRPVRRRAA